MSTRRSRLGGWSLPLLAVVGAANALASITPGEGEVETFLTELHAAAARRTPTTTSAASAPTR